MEFRYKSLILTALATCCALFGRAQGTVRGEVTDGKTGEALIGATVLVKGTTNGTVTDYDGQFEIKMPAQPGTLVVSYSGFLTTDVPVAAGAGRLKIRLDENAIEIKGVEIVGQRISEKQKSAPLTVEALDAVAVKETPQASVYNALGNLKGVDLTTASLGFTIINTRGFNSTSPVRSLQIIDGVDNQAPGLNFSLGNFLGCSDLDIQGVDLIVGASSAFYGPNAFNGVISMQTKNPFNNRGISASVKGGERNMLEGSIRWADSWKNKAGTGTPTQNGNPGGWDKVNVYGDEFFSLNNFNNWSPRSDYPGLGVYHRTGYREVDLVDYNTRNYKASAALHFRTNPAAGDASPELVFASSFCNGTTVYQGDNRFSLRNIQFFQGRVEWLKKDKWFIRAYGTRDDAGKSYDPYFTALRLQNAAKGDSDWSLNYSLYWANNFRQKAKELGYPQPEIVWLPGQPFPTLQFDKDAALAWEANNHDLLVGWHKEASDYANKAYSQAAGSIDFYQPGTARFDSAFNTVRNTLSSEGGTRFYDKSSLYHLQAERKFTPKFFDVLTIGGHLRLYTPVSKGTIFSDTTTKLSSMEMGAYFGLEKAFFDKRFRASATIRADKNLEDVYHNIDGLDREKASFFVATPAASIVWKPRPNNFFRASFSSALRNPTLTDKYLQLNVGRAILAGNIQGRDSLATIQSFLDAVNSAVPDYTKLQYFNIKPVRPEKVQTMEVGYRTTLFSKLYLDGSYYYSFYNRFLGYNIGLDVDLENTGAGGLPTVQAYRYAANSTSRVTTQGFAAGFNFYFGEFYALSGNYSFNKLNTQTDDPIVPAFNTPKHKYNLGLNGRDMPLRIGKPGKFWGWALAYKWIDGFEYEGSPQFTGGVPGYDLLDAQVNCRIPKLNSTIKLGATNLLNKKNYQVYGGPRIGRLAYVSYVYEFFEKN